MASASSSEKKSLPMQKVMNPKAKMLPDSATFWADMEAECPTQEPAKSKLNEIGTKKFEKPVLVSNSSSAAAATDYEEREDTELGFVELLRQRRQARTPTSTSDIEAPTSDIDGLSSGVKRLRVDSEGKPSEGEMNAAGDAASTAGGSMSKAQKKRQQRKRAAKSKAAGTGGSPGNSSIAAVINASAGSGMTMEERKLELLRLAQLRAAEPAFDAASLANDKDDEAEDHADTRTHTSSKLSSTRSHSDKGPSHMAKISKRMDQHLAKFGRTYDPSLRARVGQWQVEVATGLRGSAARSAHAESIQAIPEPSKEDRAQFMEELLNKPCSELFDILKSPVDEAGMCRICMKTADWSHMHSKKHGERVEELTLGGMLAGSARSARRFTSSTGQPGVLTQGSAMDFWGELLPNMPTTAEGIYRSCGHIMLDSRHKIPAAAIRRVRLAFVSYSGTGKYRANRLRFYDEIPADWASVQAEMEETGSGALAKELSPPSVREGWWPVIVVDLDRRTAAEHRVGGTTVILTCFYQLLERPVVGWKIDTSLEIVDEGEAEEEDE